MFKAMSLLAAGAGLFLFQAVGHADEATAARNFKAKCAACHGADGKGKTKQGEKMKIGDLTTAAAKKELTADKVRTTILDGIAREKEGAKQEMKGLRGKIADDQLEELVSYVRGLK